MDQRNLIHPMTAGDLVHSACVLAVTERVTTLASEADTHVWECINIIQIPKKLYEGTDSEQLLANWPQPGSYAVITFRDRQTNEQFELTLKAETPLLFTRISL